MLTVLRHFFVVFFIHLLPYVSPRTTPEPAGGANGTWHTYKGFLDAKRGSHISGIAELKKYFRRFGYLSEQSQNFSDDLFDNQLELAVSNYQLKHGLRVTGELDVDTVDQIRSPRCGVADNVQMMYGTRRYVYFTGQPRWARPTPMGLTYALSKSPEDMISYLSLQDVRDTFKRAFSRWSAVIPVSRFPACPGSFYFIFLCHKHQH